MGAEKLWTHACQQLQVQDCTSADGAFTLEPVYCLGLCSSSPALALNAQLHARVDADKFDRLIASAGGAA